MSKWRQVHPSPPLAPGQIAREPKRAAAPYLAPELVRRPVEHVVGQVHGLQVAPVAQLLPGGANVVVGQLQNAEIRHVLQIRDLRELVVAQVEFAKLLQLNGPRVVQRVALGRAHGLDEVVRREELLHLRRTGGSSAR